MAVLPIGLEITPTALVAVELRAKGKRYVIARTATRDLEHGIVADGEVVDVDRLATELRTFWAEAGFKVKQVAIGMANQRTITRPIELPRIKRKKELRDMISMQVLDTLPIPIEEAVWDFHSMDVFKDDTGVEKQRHVLVMSYRESVEKFRDAIEAAGLKLARVDIAAFAVMRSGLARAREHMQAAGHEGPEVIAFCDVGPTLTNVIVARDGICEFTRIIPYGANVFAQTMAEQFGWTQFDAERVARDAGVVAPGGTEVAGDPYTDARRVMQFVADQVASEIRTSFDYFAHTTGGSLRVGHVVISGIGASFTGLDARFAQTLGIPVSVLDPSSRLEVGSVDSLGADVPRYGTAIGLAMEDAA